MRLSVLLLALAAPVACQPNDSPIMDPGENCQYCHGSDPVHYVVDRRRHAKTWNVAGTVFDPARPAFGFEGASVQITDANGFSFSLRTNQAGNFYSRETVALPLKACVERNGVRTCQQSPVTSGACNSCHNLTQLGAPQPPLSAP